MSHVPGSVGVPRRIRFRAGQSQRRSGSIVVLTAFLMIFLMALLAFSVDVGFIQNSQVEIKRAVDAGALAGAGTLVYGTETAEDTAKTFTQHNPVAGLQLTDNEIETEVGGWNRETRTFSTAGVETPYAIRVRAERQELPMFFGRVFGRDDFMVAAEAIAMYQPRDIVLVLDYSASMSDDSEFRNISAMGQDAVEANLELIYEELGSPVYGNLTMEPKYLTVTGVAPTNTYKPQLTVEYRYNQVYVTSTKAFHRIRAYRSSGSFTTYTGAGTYNASLGKYEYTLTYGSNQITQVEVKSGYNSSRTASTNQYTENFYFNSSSTIRSHMKTCFGLTSVAWPNPGGSWDDYIDYCRTSSYNSNAGYFYKFGYLNMMNYLLEKQPSHASTPNLWQTSEYPIKAVKNSVQIFLSFMQEMDTDDRLALSVYNSSSGDAILERELDEDFTEVDNISQQRQAGHYHSNTNIGAGLREAWEELDANGREGAFKMIVLMTDGLANMPTSDPQGYLWEQVNTCVSRKYPVVTISLGADADAASLQSIADTTGGIHFNIPGGQAVEEYQEALTEAFRDIAEKRPLQLVK